MDYAWITLSAVLIAVQNAFNKLYKKNSLKGIRPALIYPAIVSLFSVLLFLSMNGFSLDFSVLSFVFAIIVALNSVMMMIVNILAFKEGSVSVCTMFMMLGGMLLPYFFGIFFLDEKVTALRIIGVIILICALVLSSLAKSGNESKKNSKKFYLYCIIIFLSNGLSGIMSKTHQINSSAIGTNDYLVWLYSARCVFAVIIFTAVTIALKKRAVASGDTISPMFGNKTKNVLAVVFSAGFAISSGLGYFLQLIVAKTLDASLLYPFVTGGTIIFTTIMAWIVFKEKISAKMWIALAIMLSGTIMFVF